MPNLNELMALKQRTLKAKLDEGSAFAHGTAKGDVSELNWGDARGFLPRRYRVSRGAFMIDSEGEQSTSEIDLVIRDNYFHPRIFEAEGRSFIPIESVYAVFEVKQKLNKAYVEQAQEKAGEVRALGRSVRTRRSSTSTASPSEPPLRIAAGILTDTSEWADPFGDPLLDQLREGGETQQLDLGFAVTHGAFEGTYDGGEVRIEATGADRGLIFFLSRLYTRLQQMGSVPGLDLGAYDREAESEAGK